MNPIQGHLNPAELIKTWLASGGWATACAVAAVALCYAIGHPELIPSLASLGAMIGGAFGKVSAEMNRLPQGVAVAPVKSPDLNGKAAETATFVPKNPA